MSRVAARKDPFHFAICLVVYVSFYVASDFVLLRTLPWLVGAFFAASLAVLVASLFANLAALRIYENRGLAAAGLAVNRASVRNLALGVLGGTGSACLVLLPPLLAGAARLTPIPDPPAIGTLSFVTAALAIGSAGEEILFRGYGFQILMAAAGPFAAIFPVGALFALMHTGNPSATWFGIANTAGFGILFGYAYYRTRDLWLPIGLHFGWNLTLPLFGVNVSGLKIGMTGHEMVWKAGALWSGGEYGPEASILTTAALVLLWVYVGRAPIGRQISPLTDPPKDGT